MTTKTKTLPRRFCLEISYTSETVDDEMIVKAVGRLSDASGFSLYSSTRDMQWWYHKYTAAKRAEQRVRNLRKRISVEVVEYDLEDAQ